MNKTVIKISYKIFLSIFIIFLLFEITEFSVRKNIKTNSCFAAFAAEEKEQYIPQNLNYSDVIKSIKREEGVPEEELENKTVTQEDTVSENNLLTLAPSEYITAAKNCVKEALTVSDNVKKRFLIRKAFRYYKEFLKYYPDNIDGLLGAGAMATFLGREDDAKNILMQAYATYPKNPNVHKALGDYSFKFSNYNNAIEYYNLSLVSGNLKDFATNLATALCYEKLGDIERAKQYFKVAQYLNPESELANSRVKMYADMEKEGYSADPRVYDEAVKPDEDHDTELETLLLDAQQIK